jgi:hypothetical protein
MKLFSIVKEIKSKAGKLHFRRFAIIESEYLSIYIHQFTQPDKDPFEHDHPWDFMLFILKGGYKEQTNNIIHRRNPGFIKYIKAEHRHKIVELNEETSISLAICGKRKREWGYHTDNGWVSNVEWANNFRNK